MSVVVEELKTIVGEDLPTDKKSLRTFMRKAVKKTSQPDAWEALSPETQSYLSDVRSSQQEQKEIPVPEGLILSASKPVINEEAVEKENDEEFKAPDAFECESVAKTFNIEAVMQMLDQNRLKIPEFQRGKAWSTKIQREFLRAVFMNIPLIGITFTLEPNGSHDRYILDGFQRLSTLQAFYKNKIHLGPGEFGNKAYFESLPRDMKNTFRYRELSVVEVKADRKFWPYIFRQINKGGKPLNDIEIRRATPWGKNHEQHPLIVMLDEFAEGHQYWLSLFGKNNRYKGLSAILRAMAMHVTYKEYQKPVAQFMDSFCSQLSNDQFVIDVGYDNLDALKEDMDLLVEALYEGMGKDAFRIAPGFPINLGVIDAMIHAGLTILENSDKSVDPEWLAVELKAIHEQLTKHEQADVRDLEENQTVSRRPFSLDTSGRGSVLRRMELAEELANERNKQKQE